MCGVIIMIVVVVVVICAVIIITMVIIITICWEWSSIVGIISTIRMRVDQITNNLCCGVILQCL